MHLYLIRHGESHINIPSEKSRSRNELDAGLTDKGQKQALAVSIWIKRQVPYINALSAIPGAVAPIYGGRKRNQTIYGLRGKHPMLFS